MAHTHTPFRAFLNSAQTDTAAASLSIPTVGRARDMAWCKESERSRAEAVENVVGGEDVKFFFG